MEPAPGADTNSVVKPDKMGIDHVEHGTAGELTEQDLYRLSSRKLSLPISQLSADEIEVELHHRHGTLFTASAHVITAIIGAGVLGLPSALAWLGWPAGVFCICAFFCVTMLVSMLLTKTYDVNGHKHRRYIDAVQGILGHRPKVALATLQYVNLVLAGIAYQIAGSKSAEAVIQAANGTAGDGGAIWKEVLVFGCVQLFVSQLPDLDSAWWASAIGAAMSIGYSTIALGLCSAKASNGHGTVGGIPGTSPSNKVFNVLNSLGTIAFAYNFSIVLLEIQDTIREPPRAEKIMRKAIKISLSTSFTFYLSVAITGYLALGDNTTYMVGDILTSPHIGPTWVIIWSNVMVFVHMISAYQVFSQPVFMSAERLLCLWFPNSVSRMNKRTLSIIFRSAYVAFTTFIACLLPFFNSIVGLIGALIFWPCGVFFPSWMYITAFKPSSQFRHFLYALNVIMLIVCLAAVVGSVQSIVISASTYSIF